MRHEQYNKEHRTCYIANELLDVVEEVKKVYRSKTHNKITTTAVIQLLVEDDPFIKSIYNEVKNKEKH